MTSTSPLARPVILLVGLLQVAAAPEGAPPQPVEATPWLIENVARGLPEQGGWLPLYVELRCLSADVEPLVLEGSVRTDRREIYRLRQWAEVAPGAPRRVWLPLWAAPAEVQQVATLEVRTADGRTVRRGDRWTFNSFGSMGAATRALVVGQPVAGVTPWPSRATFAAGGRRPALKAEFADAVPVRALPDTPLGYQAVDLVVLRDFEGEVPEPQQVAALRAWVYLGGVLIIAPASRSAAIFGSEAVRAVAAGALVEPTLREVTVRDLWLISDRPAGEGGQRGEPPRPVGFRPGGAGPARRILKDGEIRVQELSLLDPIGVSGSREIAGNSWEGPVEESGEEPREDAELHRLYVELERGQGTLGVVTFAAEDPRSENAGFLRAFWGALLEGLDVPRRGAFSRGAPQVVAPDLESVLNDPSRDVGFPFFAALVGGYLVVMGPVLYFFLKRKNRLASVIWVEPVIVIAYLGVIFGVGYITKGVLTKTRMWTVISQRQGEPLAVRESFLTVFSAAEDVYRIESPGGFLLKPVFKNRTQQMPVHLVRRPAAGGSGGDPTRGSIALEDFRLAHWEQGHVVNMDVMDVGGVQLDVPRDGSAPAATVLNRLPWTASGGVLMAGGGFFPVPRLEPGGSVQISLERPGAEEPAREEGGGTSWGDIVAMVRRLRHALLYRQVSPLLVLALERDEVDFELNRRSSLREKLDLYVLYPGS